MNTILGIIADDLTGGMETAAILIREGVDCAFVCDPDMVSSLGPVDAVVVAQKTRVMKPEDAVARSRQAIRALIEKGASHLFFKYCATFDSTDRGNIGPVTDMLFEETGAEFTGFCPSSPEAMRTVYQGHLFVGSELVSDSPKRYDPLTPMTDPNLVRVLQRQTTTNVGVLPHVAVHAGGEVLRGAVMAQVERGIRYFIMDTIYDTDLGNLALLTHDWRVMTGNSAVVGHYPRIWRQHGLLPAEAHQRALPTVGGKGVVLAGSCAERTLAQLAVFENRHPVYRIDLSRIVSAEATAKAALEWALPRLDRGPVAIATSADPDALALAQDVHGREGAAELAEEIAGSLAVALRAHGVRRFVIAGGETSGAVVGRLGLRSLNVGPYGGPGIGIATTDEPEPIALCLKSGKLGPVDLFEQMLDSMRGAGTPL